MAREFIVPEEDIGCDGDYLSYKEVVRCKECKHHEIDGSGDHWCAWSGNNIEQDDFCADGERREDG